MNNKKGIFFTFMCFLLVVLVVIIFATSRNLNLQYKQPVVQDREQNVNELYKTLDETVMPDVLRISSIQTLLKATDKVKSDYFPLKNDFPNLINDQTFVGDNSLNNWLGRVSNIVKDSYNLDVVELSFQPVAITQNDPWHVEVSGRGTILLKDTANSLAWSSTKEYIAKIPIEGLPDPLWARKGVDVNITRFIDITINGVKQRNYTDLIVWSAFTAVNNYKAAYTDNRINIISSAIKQTSFFHPTKILQAPNYLERFNGAISYDTKTGIFAFADQRLQNKFNNFKTSYVDYKFIKQIQYPDVELQYIIGVGEIDGIYIEMVWMGDRLMPVEHIFHIGGMYGKNIDIKDKLRFKLSQEDLDYFGMKAQHYHCLDGVIDNILLPPFGEKKECYLAAIAIGNPEADFT